MLETSFWLALFVSVYSYFLYPILLALVPKARIRTENKVVGSPAVTCIVTAYNESNKIAEKIEDTLNQDCPHDKFEILVVTDGCSDSTDSEVMRFDDPRVKLLSLKERRGKESAQLAGIGASESEILVFSDVSTRMKPGSVKAAIDSLGDPNVGVVSSEDDLVGGDASGEGLYVKYEMFLRRLESERAGLVGVSGSFFAIRRELALDWRTDVPSDFTVALRAVTKGKRAVSCERMRGIYAGLKNQSNEFRRKRRTALRGMSALSESKEVLNPFRFGLFSFQAVSHKLMRWAVPWGLVAFGACSAVLAQRSYVALAALFFQVVFYGAAALGHAVPASRESSLVRIPHYFLQANLALAVALVDFMRGKRIVTWEPSRR